LWAIWLVLLFWIFVLPYDIPGQRKRKDTPLDLLKNRFATGQMTKEEFQSQKDLLMK
jgi:putative membrane protein